MPVPAGNHVLNVLAFGKRKSPSPRQCVNRRPAPWRPNFSLVGKQEKQYCHSPSVTPSEATTPVPLTNPVAHARTVFSILAVTGLRRCSAQRTTNFSDRGGIGCLRASPTSSMMDFRETTFPLLRIKWRRNAASIR